MLVPAVKNIDDTDVLKKISELPEWARPAFEGTDTLNRIQTKVFDLMLPPSWISVTSCTLEWKVHRLLYHTTLGSRVIKR